MKAVRLFAKGDLRVESVAEPAVTHPKSVKIRVLAAGICGSDLHNYKTGQWISRAPSTAGHEFTGMVVEIGSEVKHLSVGDTVVADSRVTCRQCRNCREGFSQICEKLGFVGEVVDGGFAEHVVLDESLLSVADPSVDPRALAMAEPVAVALHALSRLAAPQNAEILIAGCGPIGAICAILAHQKGHKIILSDKNADRVTCVAELTDARIIDLNSREPSIRAPRFAIDATGASSVVQSLIQFMAGGGALALVGIGAGSISVPINLMVEKEINLLGCHAYRDELTAAVKACAELQPFLLQIIEREVTLSEVPEAYEELLSGQSIAPKTIIRI